MADEPDPPGVLVTPRVVVADEVHHLDEDVLNLRGNIKFFHLLEGVRIYLLSENDTIKARFKFPPTFDAF